MATATLTPSDYQRIMEYADNGYSVSPTNPAIVGQQGASGGDRYRILVRFDTSSIPVGSTINSVTLRLYRKSGVTSPPGETNAWAYATLSVYPSNKAWAEGESKARWSEYDNGAAWDTAGGDYGSLLDDWTDPAPEPPEAKWAEFTLAELPGANGYEVIASNETSAYVDNVGLGYATGEAPELVIDYTAPVGHLTLPEWIGECVMAEISAEQPLRFFLRNTDGTAGTGKSPTVEIRKHGASAWATPTGAVTELGNGWYQVAYAAADQDTPGQLLLRATATGCDAGGACYTVFGDTNPYTGTVDANVVSVGAGVKIDANLVAIDENDEATDEPTLTLKELYDGGVSRAAVDDYSPTTTTFLTTLPLEDPDHYADQAVAFTSGGLAGQTAHIDTSETEGSLTRLTLLAPLTAAPADGDALVVIGRLA